MCTLAGQCLHHVDVILGAMPVDGCERAIYELAKSNAVNLINVAIDQIGRPGWEETPLLRRNSAPQGLYALAQRRSRRRGDEFLPRSTGRAASRRKWELRTSTNLARLWQSEGKRQEAYDLLAPLYGWLTEGFDTKDLQDAKVLLAELG
jgi:hypothetical protein